MAHKVVKDKKVKGFKGEISILLQITKTRCPNASELQKLLKPSHHQKF